MRVAIVGAGPTGLTAANLLGQAGIETVLLERNAELGTEPKAITIDDEGLRICQALGLEQEMMAHAHLNLKAFYVSQGRYIARVAPTHQEYGYPQISTFYQPEFERILFTGLARFPCVSVLLGHTITQIDQDTHQAILTVQATNGKAYLLACDYVLGCDGGRSTLRRLLHIPLNRVHPGHLLFPFQKVRRSGRTTRMRQYSNTGQTTNGQNWLVVDCQEDSSSPQDIFFFCNPHRPAVTLPAPGRRRRWEFMLKPYEKPAQLLDDAMITRLIKQTYLSLPQEAQKPWHIQASVATGQSQIIRKTVYTFHSLVADSFSIGRIFLLGDAAHLMPPFGGQGMNSGLRDAHNLCWKLIQVLQQRIGPRLLTSYQQERKPHTTQMILFSSTLGKIIMSRQPTIAQMRDLGLQCINAVPLLHRQLSEMHVKPTPRYPHGFLLPIQLTVFHHHRGTLIPQPWVQTAQGKQVRLDDILGQHFALIELYEKREHISECIRTELWQRLGIRYVSISSDQQQLKPGITNDCSVISVIDTTGQISRLLHDNPDAIMLLRPDHYIMGIFHISKMPAIEQVLHQYIMGT